MSYRILHLADLHLDRAFAGMACHGDLARRRRLGLRDALRRAGDAARSRNCDALTIGGDLYEHERADLETGRFLAETFASLRPLRVLIAAGNHDALLPDSLYARMEWPDNVAIFASNTLSPVPLADGLTLWGLSHLDPAWRGDPLAASPVGGDGGVHLALFHGAELGSRPEGKSVHGPFAASRIAELGFAAALTGHYHRRRVDEAARLVYPGSPEPLTFDEDGGRGPVVVSIAGDGAVSYEPLSLNAWWTVTAHCDLSGCSSFTAVLDAACSAARTAAATGDPDRGMLRLLLGGEVAPEITLDVPTIEAAARDLTGLAVVQARDLSEPALDLAAAAGDPTARGAFTREVLASIHAAEGDPREQAVLADALRYGLQALGGVEVGLR
ncbi:MAG TPA: metallophosphoesterase [Candidatus Angelobacter sp.]|nr:metallophosphoesterase [Candidatus Angelobacter sp.]